MEDPRRRSTLSFTFILCFSLWLTSGETSDYESSLNWFSQHCYNDCPKKYITSKYNVPCKDNCEMRGYDYYWCNSRMGWDYCSPSNNVDYQGFTCQTPCDNYGEDYKECRLQSGEWSKCGRVEPRAMIHYTKKLKECIDSCQYYESGDYFWCFTEDGWDYCSPLPHYTYKNEPCRPNHECGRHGKNYNWCYTTDNNDWDYCGTIGHGECEYSQTHGSQRQPEYSRVICTSRDDDVDDAGYDVYAGDNNNNNRRVTFRHVAGHCNIKKPEKDIFIEALVLINKWNNQHLTDQARSSLIKSQHLHIDNQGLINRDNQRYHNLEIQFNQQHGRRESTVAHIIVPVDTSAEYMRLAFRESLEGQVRVEIEVDNNPYPPPENTNQRCCKR
ncbi:COMM domain-containing protein 1 isoform X1 [Paralichthys olivaceus]|uniref:COMM domain-containing protein 1 isoform X1 n=1 Tax=Paralichthys olivaceus TaxID=8255 RepID=UPI003750EC31